MPIKIPNELPARAYLEEENIFVMTETRAMTQDIRPLKIGILNLMPTKVVTETQLLRLLGNTPLQVDVELVKLDTYEPKNTPQKHLLDFYRPFSQIKDKKFDGFIITGAPVERMEFGQVEYWPELCEIMDWSDTHVTSTLHICWGAQAGIYRHYGVEKVDLGAKTSGVFLHEVLKPRKKLMRGFDNVFLAPHSRWTTIDDEALAKCDELEVVAVSPMAGTHIVTSKKGKHIFVFGHQEYDARTLANEYFRDVAADKRAQIPFNYFPGDNPHNEPIHTWRAHANLLFSNWLNYYVYQATPYETQLIGESW